MKKRICELEGCEDTHYAKGLCHKHYELNRRHGRLVYLRDIPKPKCSVPDCPDLATSLTSGLCLFHKERQRNGVPLDRPKGIRGELNNNWRGGVSEYPNHYEMKKMRLIVLEEANFACHYCGKPTNIVHHIDKSKDNHKRNNLVASCGSCNQKRAKIPTSKFRRIYGKTLKELANNFNVGVDTIIRRHNSGKLFDWKYNWFYQI